MSAFQLYRTSWSQIKYETSASARLISGKRGCGGSYKMCKYAPLSRVIWPSPPDPRRRPFMTLGTYANLDWNRFLRYRFRIMAFTICSSVARVWRYRNLFITIIITINRRTTERTNRRTDEGTGREHTVHTRSHKVSQTMGTGVRYYVCVFLWCWARSVSDS